MQRNHTEIKRTRKHQWKNGLATPKSTQTTLVRNSVKNRVTHLGRRPRTANGPLRRRGRRRDSSGGKTAPTGPQAGISSSHNTPCSRALITWLSATFKTSTVALKHLCGHIRTHDTRPVHFWGLKTRYKPSNGSITPRNRIFGLVLANLAEESGIAA